MSKQIEEVMALVNAYAAMQGVEPYDKQIDAHDAIEAKLRELLPVWQPIESAPVGVSVLACNALGYVGRAVLCHGKWEGIGKPNGWMPMPKAKK